MVYFPAAAIEHFDTRWQAFCHAAAASRVPIPSAPGIMSMVRAGFGFSEFVSQICIRSPALLNDLIVSGDLQRRYGADDYVRGLEAALATVTDEAGLAAGLRRRRRREMVRIACRDLSGVAGLDETLSDLSALADACISACLDRLHPWHCERFGTPLTGAGRPQELVVLAMGKLGAAELNFSSDIDLIFAFPESGKTTSGHAVEDFFVRLCRKLIRILNDKTADGFVFRVDTGLRPFGESGPLAMSFDAMESYYQNQGREWERYALIKAREVGHGGTAGRPSDLLERLKPFIYRRYLDFGVFESLREMKQKIAREVQRKGLVDNIKLGPGGIREVEFFGQVFQLTRGGVFPALQIRGIQQVLSALAAENLVPPSVCDELRQGYRFLRRVENRLQAAADQQTHVLPSTAGGRSLLAGAMGFEDPQAFAQRLRLHSTNVHRHFMRLLEAGGSEKEAAENGKPSGLEGRWESLADDAQRAAALADAGFGDPPALLALLASHFASAPTRSMSEEGRARLWRLIPRLLSQCSTVEQPDRTFQRILELILTIQRRTSYISLLLENPTALVHLVRLTAASPWVSHFVSRHPVLLDELLDPRSLYKPPEPGEMAADLQRRLDRAAGEDLENQIEALCIFKQVNVLRVAAADVTGALALMRVSDYLTDIATTILGAVVEMVYQYLTRRHGTPACRLDGQPLEKGFSVIGYGKLGGLELGYGSDLDLVFLHAGTTEMTRGGRHPIDTPQFFSRLGQRVIHILTAHTRAGKLYEIDMRLRPDGGGGLLVSHVDAFAEYQKRRARTWEHQALVRARPITGDERIAACFQQTRREVLSLARRKSTLAAEVTEMRRRLRGMNMAKDPSVFDLKQGVGGIVDIEFLVQYLVLLLSRRHPELLDWTDNVRILQTLIETGSMDNATADFLKHAYLILRAHAHKLSLQEQPAEISNTRLAPLSEGVRRVWSAYLGADM